VRQGWSGFSLNRAKAVDITFGILINTKGWEFVLYSAHQLTESHQFAFIA